MTYDFELLTINPFLKLRFLEGKNILVQSAAQKWPSLQKMIVLMHWSFWQKMSNFYFSLEYDPKGGPLDNFSIFLQYKTHNFAIFPSFIIPFPLDRIILFNRHIFHIVGRSCITSSISTFSSYPACYCCLLASLT